MDPKPQSLPQATSLQDTKESKHTELARSRRQFLSRVGGGFGSIALLQLLAEDGLLADTQQVSSASVFAPKPAQRLARTKRVIFLFMDGGPSHLDLFDPKPAVNRFAGRPLPRSIQRPYLPMGETDSPVLASQRHWRHYGESGISVSDWMPHLAQCVDDIAVVRSCQADGLLHVRGVCQMNTGSIEAGRPSLGSWTVYGLGSETQSLPSFVVLLDSNSEPPGGPRNWGTGYMPATYQGVRFREGTSPILFLDQQRSVGLAERRHELDLIRELNRAHARRSGQAGELEARIESYELAYRMQSAAPEAVDLSAESPQTRSMYGIEKESTAVFGRMCLLARRLVERGVRFVQLYNGSGSKWDAHSKIEQNHSVRCRSCDQPIAALLQDLKTRGLLEETLVVWGGEFGRTPQSEKGDGRDHNPYGFTMWFAGGGVRGGQVIGATDDFGLHAVEDPVHVHDIHATILHLLGLDHERLTFRHNGRDDRLTEVYGQVITQLLA